MVNANQDNVHVFKNVDDQPQTDYSMMKQLSDQTKKLEEESRKQ